MTMQTNELYAAVARRVDTAGTQINVAETSRVISEFFNEIADRINGGQISDLDAVKWLVEKLRETLED